MKAYFDTNVLVAALRPNHVHHAESLAAYDRVRASDIKGCLSGQGLSEFYSVMTRAPIDVPVGPAEVQLVLERSVLPHFEIVDVSAASYRAAIAACAKSGWRGGRIHDAVHIQAAAQSGCELIYTHDLEHFRSLAPEWGDRIQKPPAVR